MPRGVTPRRPARTGRQDRAKKTNLGTGAFAGPGRGKASAAASKKHKQAGAKPAPAAKVKVKVKVKGYNPIAPGRVTEILHRLDQVYPDVTCALTHASAWEL